MRNPLKKLRRKNRNASKQTTKEQKPSWLSELLVGDLNVSGHIEIEVPRATNRVIHIDISTAEKTPELTPEDIEALRAAAFHLPDFVGTDSE
jgi:hypothetical protein